MSHVSRTWIYQPLYSHAFRALEFRVFVVSFSYSLTFPVLEFSGALPQQWHSQRVFLLQEGTVLCSRRSYTQGKIEINFSNSFAFICI